MTAFFDTSVLVPVFYVDHIHHKASLERLAQFEQASACCGAHSLAEVYSTLTRIPGRNRVSSDDAIRFIGSIRDRLSIVALTSQEYIDALQASSDLRIVGGGIYDALLARCAIKAEAETIYTWNLRHYLLCGPEVTQRLRTP